VRQADYAYFRGGVVASSYYTLSASAIAALDPTFKGKLGFDVSQVRIYFGFTGKGDAYTLGNRVTIDRANWDKLSPRQMIRLLAHEITHSVQYEKIGLTSFLNRYIGLSGEYYQKANYVVPGSLSTQAVGSFDIVDKNYTLDQIANRIRDEF
jgi:hypothetical protein